jgi:carbamate kinase
VPSPAPREIVELDCIRHLVEAGYVVTAVGGGGIPVVRGDDGDLRGVEAVIDKDYATALLASRLGADLFVISTAVEKVCLDFKKPTQRTVDQMTAAEARGWLAEGQFGKGSMAPKIEAVLQYLDRGGRRAIVTCPEKLEEALAGRSGTLVTP